MNINTVKDSLNKVRQGIKDRQDVEQDLRDVLDWCKRSRDTANTITIDPNKELQQTVENLSAEIKLLHGTIYDLEVSRDKLTSLQRRIKRNKKRKWIAKVNRAATVGDLNTAMKRAASKKNRTWMDQEEIYLLATLCITTDEVDEGLRELAAKGICRVCIHFLHDRGWDVAAFVKQHMRDNEATSDITPLDWNGEAMKFSIGGETARDFLATVGINKPI